MALRLALLWHMHQPSYTDPTTGEALLPWVRLHATRAYYDMGRALEAHPGVRVTTNFVPSLLDQLERAAQDTARERYRELTRAAPEDLGEHERLFLLRQFFMVNRERWVNPVPRYRELLQRRGPDPARLDPSAFSAADLRDLQVHFNLAWMGFAARRELPAVAALLEKGEGYTEEDKGVLLEMQQEVLGRVVPLWRRLAERGQVELSSTPYFHPILPLLCDSDAARRALPDARLPSRFAFPQDARVQVRRALERHQQLFGEPPTGMWPAEGALSPEALEVLAAEGVRWLATDEGNLFRSRPAPRERGALYQPWECEAGGRPVRLAFRDRSLSDGIGFSYAQLAPAEAVRDFLLRVRQAGAEAVKAGVADPFVAVILDGENAWEHYEGGGEAFLDAFYSGIAAEPGLRTVPMAEVLEGPAAKIDELHSGSWIESSYRIWISHPEDNLAWDLLGRVRRQLAEHEARGELPPERLSEAFELLLSAEGSDWFWWYGDDFETENAAEFDALFRERLIRAATLLGETPPRRLLEPIGAKARSQSRGALAHALPTALLSPRIDGRAESWPEWLGAGTLLASGGRGSMFRGDAPVAAVRFGFDLEHLYLRLDPAGAGLHDLTLQVLAGPAGENPARVSVHLAREGDLPVSVPAARAVLGSVLELSVPLAGLGLGPGRRMELSLRLQRGELEVDRLPRGAPLVLDVPDEAFGAWNWLV